MHFCPKNRDDIVKYYRGTYLKLREFGDQLFLIEGVDSSKVQGTHESGEKFTIYLNDDTPYEIEYILPHKSFFQLGPVAAQLQRIPAKQYFRGLCSLNTMLCYLGPDGTVRNFDINFETLSAFVNKGKFPTLSQTLETAATAATFKTMALSSRMMYHRGNRNLYMDFTPIARLDSTLKKITVTKAVFLDEINDLLKSNSEQEKFRVELHKPKEKTDVDVLLKEMGEAPKKKLSSQKFLAANPSGGVNEMYLNWAGEVLLQAPQQGGTE